MENILWGYILFMSVLTFSVCGWISLPRSVRKGVCRKGAFGLSILGWQRRDVSGHV